jgi:hypothetical protein
VYACVPFVERHLSLSLSLFLNPPVRDDGGRGDKGLAPLRLHLLHQQVRQLPHLLSVRLGWYTYVCVCLFCERAFVCVLGFIYTCVCE